MFETSNSIEIEAPAKVNLFLEVLGRRPDGYHDLQSVFQAISIYDKVTVRAAPGDSLSIVCNVKELETPSNLALKAARAYLDAVGARARVDIGIAKEIPLQAGLGGGSSDAAAVLVALNELAGRPLSDDRLRTIGATVGSDVPFFVEGGTALVEGVGERVTPIDVAGSYYFIVLYPGFGVSTARVYEHVKSNLTKESAFVNLLTTALAQGNLETARRYFFNRLEETAFTLEDRLYRVKAAMQSRLDGAPVMLSGSGASLFCAFADRDIALGGYHALRETDQGGLFLAESIRGRRKTATPKGESRGD